MSAGARVVEGLDHLVYAGPDLERAVAAIERLTGVRPSPGGRHPGYGTRNALLRLGPAAYLEVIGPDREAPDPGRPRPFGIDGLAGPRLAHWAVRASDLERRMERARARGHDPGIVREGGRVRPDGVRLAWRIGVREGMVPAEGGIVPFLIDWGATPHPAETAASGCRLVGLRAEHPEPRRARALLEALEVAIEVAEGPTPALLAAIDTPAGRFELR